MTTPEWITVRVLVADLAALKALIKEMRATELSDLPEEMQARLREGKSGFTQGNVFGVAVAIARAEIAKRQRP